jgi:hypothetical protein
MSDSKRETKEVKRTAPSSSCDASTSGETKKVDGWTCFACTTFIPASYGIAHTACPTCHMPRPFDWACPTCTFINGRPKIESDSQVTVPKLQYRCEQCHTPHPGLRDGSLKALGSLDMLKVHRSPDNSWSCPGCLARRPPSATNCVRCDFPDGVLSIEPPRAISGPLLKEHNSATRVENKWAAAKAEDEWTAIRVAHKANKYAAKEPIAWDFDDSKLDFLKELTGASTSGGCYSAPTGHLTSTSARKSEKRARIQSLLPPTIDGEICFDDDGSQSMKIAANITVIGENLCAGGESKVKYCLTKLIECNAQFHRDFKKSTCREDLWYYLAEAEEIFCDRVSVDNWVTQGRYHLYGVWSIDPSASSSSSSSDSMSSFAADQIALSEASRALTDEGRIRRMLPPCSPITSWDGRYVIDDKYKGSEITGHIGILRKIASPEKFKDAESTVSDAIQALELHKAHRYKQFYEGTNREDLWYYIWLAEKCFCTSRGHLADHNWAASSRLVLFGTAKVGASTLC